MLINLLKTLNLFRYLQISLSLSHSQIKIENNDMKYLTSVQRVVCICPLPPTEINRPHQSSHQTDYPNIAKCMEHHQCQKCS